MRKPRHDPPSLLNSSWKLSRSRFPLYRPIVEVLEDRTLLSLITAPAYAASSQPVSVAVGDFNADGIPDLALAGQPSGMANILLGKGDGTFQAPVMYAAGSQPVSVAVADFNGDGHLDLAVANNIDAGTVTVLPGNGDGTFQPGQSYVVGSDPASVAVGDFDGNGTLDLAVADANSQTVSIVPGNGDGTFQASHSYAVGPGQAQAVAVGDFNGDGRLDLGVAISTLSGMVSILLGNGDGTFQSAQNYTGGGASSVAVGDFDGDGHLDLAATNFYANTVAILLGNGDGTFGAAQNYPVGTNPSAVVIGDFDGNGTDDLAVADRNWSTVSVMLGQGDGTFNAAQNGAVGGNPLAVALGDFNGDGHIDLAVANSTSNTVSVLLGNGTGAFPAAPVSYAAGAAPYPVAVGDMNSDGIVDIAVANLNSNTVSIFVGKGDGTFQAAQTSAAGFSPVSIAIADLQGNGIPDLVVANLDGTVSILLGKGDGTFQPAQSYAAGVNPYSVAVGDFNGDGIADLAVADSGSNTVSILLGNGDGTFQPAQSYAVGLHPVSVAVGDMNGDSIRDLIVASSGVFPDFTGTLSILLGNGDGTFQAAQNDAAGAGCNGVAVGDFNGDGRADLVTTNFAALIDPRHPNDAQIIESDVRVYVGNGDGTVQAAQTYPAGLGPCWVALADFNRDGILDIGVANGLFPLDSTTVSILLGNGDGSFQTAQSYAAGANPYSVAAGDFNGDGYPDLAVADNAYQGPGTMTVLLNGADWGGGHAALPLRRPSIAPTANGPPLREPFSALAVPSQPQGLRIAPVTFTEDNQCSMQQWLMGLTSGQSAQSHMAFTARPHGTDRYDRDTALEGWRDPVLDVLAMHLLT